MNICLYMSSIHAHYDSSSGLSSRSLCFTEFHVGMMGPTVFLKNLGGTPIYLCILSKK